MTYEEMKPDCAYRVTKGNTDGGIIEGDVLYIDSERGDLFMMNCGWYSKDDDLQEKDVTDFECEVAEDYRVFSWGGKKGLILKAKLEAVLVGA